MSEGSEVTFYEVVSNPDQKRLFWERAAAEKATLRFCSRSGKEWSSRVLMVNAEGHVECELGGQDAPFAADEVLTVWIQLSDRRAFSEVTPRYKSASIWIPIDAPLSQQQKRKSFRMDIPVGYVAHFQPEGFGDLQVTVKDINTLGLGLIWPASAGEPPQDVRGKLVLGNHQPVQIGGEIRFRHKLEDTWSLGLRIEHSMFESEGPLFDLLLAFRQDTFKNQ